MKVNIGNEETAHINKVTLEIGEYSQANTSRPSSDIVDGRLSDPSAHLAPPTGDDPLRRTQGDDHYESTPCPPPNFKYAVETLVFESKRGNVSVLRQRCRLIRRWGLGKGVWGDCYCFNFPGTFPPETEILEMCDLLMPSRWPQSRQESCYLQSTHQHLAFA